MSVGLWLAIVAAIIGFSLLAARICHIGNLERDPIDIAPAKQPNVLSYLDQHRRFERRAKG